MNEEIRLDDIVNWYSEHLRDKHPKNLARFEADRKRDYEVAVAEAVTFHVLTYRNVHPEVHEEAGTGGADFMCWASMNPFAKRARQNEFVVEATAISQEAVTRRSGIPTEITGLGGGAIGLLTPNFWRKAGARWSAKALSDASCPFNRFKSRRRIGPDKFRNSVLGLHLRRVLQA